MLNCNYAEITQQLTDFRNIKQFLTQDAAVSVANAFVSSRLDYCNSLFRSLSKVNLHRLQSIQNSAGRIVTNLCKYTRITPILLAECYSKSTCMSTLK